MNNNLEDKIIGYLQQQRSPKAAAQILKHIGPCQKKFVNAILYRLLKDAKVVKSIPQGSKPMWSLANGLAPRGGQFGGTGYSAGAPRGGQFGGTGYSAGALRGGQIGGTFDAGAMHGGQIGGTYPAGPPQGRQIGGTFDAGAMHGGQIGGTYPAGPPQGRQIGGTGWLHAQSGGWSQQEIPQFQMGSFHTDQYQQMPGYSGVPYPHLLHPPWPRGGRGGRGENRGGRGNRRGWGNRGRVMGNRGEDRGRGRGENRGRGMGNRGENRGRGMGNRGNRGRGRGENRGRGSPGWHMTASAPSQPGFSPSSQKHTHFQKKKMNKLTEDRPRDVSVTQFDDGGSVKSDTKNMAPNEKALTPCETGAPNAMADSTAATDAGSTTPKHKRDDSGNTSDSVSMEEEEDCYMEDFEAPNLTTRFQDMMGTLTFDDPAFHPDEDMLEEEEPFLFGGLNYSVSERGNLAPNWAMMMKEPSEAAKKTGAGDVVSDLTKCGGNVNDHAGTPMSAGTTQAEDIPPGCSLLSSEVDVTTNPGVPVILTGAPPSSIPSPPMPPRQWIESHQALFPNSPPPVMEPVAATEFQNAGGLGKDCNPSTSTMQVRGIGRGQGLLPLSLILKQSQQRPPGGSVTVSGSLDVREVESSYFSVPSSAVRPVPATATPVTIQTTATPVTIQTTATPVTIQTSQPADSSSKTDSGFRNVDEFKWQPLAGSAEKLQNRDQCSAVSSSPQRSLIPQGAETMLCKGPEISQPCHHLSLASSSSSLLQDQNSAASFMSVEKLATASYSPAGGLNFMSTSSLHPRLQKFAAEGLTLVSSSESSALAIGPAGKTTAGCGVSCVPFQKPPTPMELMEQERGNMGLVFRPLYHDQSNDHPSTTLTPSFMTSTFPHHLSQPATPLPYSFSPVSLPALAEEDEEERGDVGAASLLQISSESFAALNKNPISALMEHAQSRRTSATIEVVSQRGPSHRPVFLMAARVGSRQFPRIRCHNKKDGKKEAADLALRTLMAEGQLSATTPSPSGNIAPEDMTHFDKIAALTHQAFNTLIAGIPESLAGRKVIAGLVMKRGADDQGIVISLGSGNRCITGDQLSLEGNTVNDSHAEIITRRGFLRFLYQQLLQYKDGQPHDLFEPGSGGKLRMKNGVTFHLYISTAPCGDGALFSPRDAESNSGRSVDADRREHHPTFSSAVQGLLRTKMEGGEGTIPVDSKELTVQTWDGIVRGERLRTMSCTDKICRWNVLGLQGALLSNFLEPVYLDSLTLGFLYDHGHLSRAVCCRLARGDSSMEQALAPGFHLNHPWLGRVTACQPLRETQKTKAFSINWVIGDSAPEILDGTVGHCYTVVEKKLFSRVSKQNLYESFRTVAGHLGRDDLRKAASYREAKMAAKEFQTSKAAMFGQFRQMGCGWVKKPQEEEMFS